MRIGETGLQPIPGAHPHATRGQEASRERLSPQQAEEGRRSQNPRRADGETMSDKDLALLKKMRARDTQVRAHEMAHLAAAGGLARGMSFSYELGPDGRRYATGGEVGLDMSTTGDPRSTISKMTRVQAAAMAPADPSPQDRAIAAQAQALILQAAMELSMEMRQAQAEVAAEAEARAQASREKAASTYEAVQVDVMEDYTTVTVVA